MPQVSDIPLMIWNTYISLVPDMLANDILILFIGKVLTLITIILLFVAIFSPIIFIPYFLYKMVKSIEEISL